MYTVNNVNVSSKNLENRLITKHSINKNSINNDLFYKWNIGTINIRTGDEKSEGARIYMIAKQVAEAKLLVCSLQEVRYRNNGKQVINLDTGESFLFFWSGPKKRRDAGVGVMIRQCKEVTFDDPDVLDTRVIALNISFWWYYLQINILWSQLFRESKIE